MGIDREKVVEVERRAEELMILNALRRILRLLRLGATDVQASLGVSAAQLYVLGQLAEDHDGASIGQLAQQTLTDRSSVASVVDRLVAAGLADRTVSAEDRRRAEIRITRAGEKLVAKAPAPPTAQLVAALETLSDPELSGLARSLASLVHAMGLDESPASMMFEDSDGNGSARPKKPRAARRK